MDPRIIVSHMAHVSTAPVPAPFTEAAARDALTLACARARLNTAGARLLRLGENAIWNLPGESTVVRIARSMALWDDVTRETRIARWLADSGIPAARIREDIPQPVAADGRPVTFWRHIDGRNGEPRDIEDLARLLRRVHQLPRPGQFHLPDENILGRVRGRLEQAVVGDADRHFLLGRLAELEQEVPRLRFPLAASPTHGDAHVQNLMVTGAGPVLIDFERFAWGQPEWDLSMTATEYRVAGWWTDDEYRRFCGTYGYDVTQWSGFGVLRRTHELKMISWLSQNVGQSPEITREFETRMRTLRGESPGRDWQPF